VAGAVTVGVLLALARWVVTPYRVSGPSMQPTLEGGDDGGAGDVILVDRLSYAIRAPRRWEVVVLRGGDGADGTASVKRIVGLPGETVEIWEGAVFVDGRAVPPPPALGAVHVVSKGAFGHVPVRLGPEEYFVLGDNSYLSRDSRSRGPVGRSSIVGRAFLVLLPAGRLGAIP
jgi:signal peptidase I